MLTHHREYSYARNRAFDASSGRRRGSRRNGPNLRATGLATTTAVAGILGGALFVAHGPAAASPAAGTAGTTGSTLSTSLVRMPKTGLSAYSTAVSRAVRAERRHAREVRRRREERLRREARLRRERAQERARRRQERIAAAQPSGTPQEMAQTLVLQRGWSESEFTCLDELWNRESGWDVYATNPGSGAYGIPQALPGSKMAEAGSDWQTNPLTQIRWGLDYIAASYGSPCAALEHSNATGFY